MKGEGYVQNEKKKLNSIRILFHVLQQSIVKKQYIFLKPPLLLHFLGREHIQ